MPDALVRAGWAVVVLIVAALVAVMTWAVAATPNAPAPAPAAAGTDQPMPLVSAGSSAAPAPAATTPAPDAGSLIDATDTAPGAVVAEWAVSATIPDGVVLTNPKSKPLRLPAPDVTVGVYQATPLQPLPVPGARPVTGGDALTLPGGAVEPAGPGSDAVRAMIVRYFPANQVANAVRVSMCESGQRNVTSQPNTDGTRDHGIFQLNDGGTFQELARRLGADPADVSVALNPEWNVKAAGALFAARGWQPWTCARKLGIS